MRFVSSLFKLLLAATVAGAALAEAPEFYPSADPALSEFPFSEAVRLGDVLYLSGQIGVPPGSTRLVPGGVGAETQQTLDNIVAILERRGASLRDVVKCTVFLADIDDWPAVNEVYAKVFSKPYPARSAVAGGGLALGALVEIECLARAPERSGAP